MLSYPIRFKDNILLCSGSEELKEAKQLLEPSGRTHPLKDSELTAQQQPVSRAFCCKKADMKEAWLLILSNSLILIADRVMLAA